MGTRAGRSFWDPGGCAPPLPASRARSLWQRPDRIGDQSCWVPTRVWLPTYLARPALGARSLSGPWGRALSGPWGPPAHLGLGASRPLGPAWPLPRARRLSPAPASPLSPTLPARAANLTLADPPSALREGRAPPPLRLGLNLSPPCGRPVPPPPRLPFATRGAQARATPGRPCAAARARRPPGPARPSLPAPHPPLSMWVESLARRCTPIWGDPGSAEIKPEKWSQRTAPGRAVLGWQGWHSAAADAGT